MSGVISNLYEASSVTVESVIQNCTRIIERIETVAGAGRKVRNPMLSVFLGENAESHIREIQEAYYSCWSDRARNLKILKGAYSAADIEDAIVQSTAVREQVTDSTTVSMAWFWDIMDDNFDQYFSCVKQPYFPPVGIKSHKFFFVFCSQKNTINQEKTRLRLRDQLIPWAKQNKVPLVILSDSTRIGVLNQRGLSENYRLAATMMMIMNTYYLITEKDLGKEMTFEFNKGGIWSASYYGCSKNFEDIVGVSLLTIIKRYRQLGQRREDYSRSTSVQSRLCGHNKNYYDLLDEIFEKSIVSKCRGNTDFWSDVPYTQQVKEMEEYLLHCNQPQGGFFKGLFSKKPRPVSPNEVISSLGDFWKCCVNLYYIDPVIKWIDSPEGMKELKDDMYSRMATTLNYDEMQMHLYDEINKILALIDKGEAALPNSQLTNGGNIGQLLHKCALYQVKRSICKKVLKLLADTMEVLSQNAGGFNELLEKVQNSLGEDHMERSVVEAYGDYVKELIDHHEDIVLKSIRPCENESELLQQLEYVFSAFVQRDTRRVFRNSLQGDLQFRIDCGGAATAVNVISDCFSYNMAEAGRLLTLSVPVGNLYCIMNDAMEDMGGNIAAEAIGNRFIVSRSDRIERLFVFKVAENDIMFSNYPE